MTLPQRCSQKCGAPECGAPECATTCARSVAPRPARDPYPGPLGDRTLQRAFRTAMGLPV